MRFYKFLIHDQVRMISCQVTARVHIFAFPYNIKYLHHSNQGSVTEVAVSDSTQVEWRTLFLPYHIEVNSERHYIHAVWGHTTVV